ncbi:MAG: lysophospholipid acyltransferase family protein [Myxococcota bacterium]
MARVVVDHRGSAVEATHWRTLMVFAHTFSGSSRIVRRALAGELDPAKVDAVVARWVAHTFRLARATVLVDGEHHVVAGQPYVLMSNHRSLLDIPAVIAAFPGRLRFVAKQELRRVPMFGRAMDAAGVVFVDRADRARAIGQLERARGLLEAGTSVWVAAEGTRSRDGSLGSLKKGGFHVARALGVPILPTWIDGSHRVIEPGHLTSTTGQTVTVTFGPPIPTRAGDGRGGEVPVDLLVAATRAALLGLAPPVPEPSTR